MPRCWALWRNGLRALTQLGIGQAARSSVQDASVQVARWQRAGCMHAPVVG